MKTLLMAPELFRTEGGISRILRLYLRALAQLAGPGDRLGYVALNDLPVPAARVLGCIGREATFSVACNHSKLHFVLACLGHGWTARRVICGHIHQLFVMWVVSLCRPSLQYCLVAHGVEVWRPFSLVEKWALRRAHRILCVSEYTRRQMLRFDPGLDPARLVVVPNTFDPGFAGQGPANPALSSQLSALSSQSAEDLSSRRDDGPVILTVARLTKDDVYKGVDTMVEAMPGILREFPRAQLRIVGGGDDLPRLQAIAESRELGSAVTFTGILPDQDLRAEYQACDLFALPSRKEGFGLVYLEAMAFGKPCLAARAGGAPEVVNDEVGAVVEYGNIDQIVQGVMDLVRHPRHPAGMLRRVRLYSFPCFQNRLASSIKSATRNNLCAGYSPRILIYRLGSMGDALVALPCIKSLRRWYPGAHITWLTNLPVNEKARASADLLEGVGLVDEYISYPLGLRELGTLVELRRLIRHGRFDMIVDLAAPRGRRKSVRDALFFRLCGIKKIYGIPWAPQDLKCLPNPLRPGYYEAEASRIARRLDGLGHVDLADRTLWNLDLRAGEREWANRTLTAAGIAEGYLVMCVGTKADAKDWTPENWRALIDRLGKQFVDLGLVMIGAPDERERSERCMQPWPGAKVNLAGQLTARGSAAVLAGASLFVGHDSGPMHLAASVGTRCVVVFAARNLPGQWYPSGEGHTVIYHQTECFGCGLEVCVTEKKRCILSVTVDEMLEHISQALAHSRPQILQPAVLPQKERSSATAMAQGEPGRKNTR